MPSTATPATVWVSCRVDVELKNRLADLAAASHRTISDQLRHIINEATA